MTPNPLDEKIPLLKDESHQPVPSETGTDLNSPGAPSSSQRHGPFYWLSLVTVEPALFLHILGFSMEIVMKTNMLVDKTCSIYFNYSSDVCANLDSGNYKQEQDNVQTLTNRYNLYCQILEYGPSVFAMMLLGTLSDTRGRRLPLLLPLFGGIIKSVGLCVNVYWWSLKPVYVIFSFFPYGMFGGAMGMYMAAYAYLSDITDEKWRTTRLSLAMVMLFATLSGGQALSAFIFSRWGYKAVFLTDLVCCILSFLYILVRITNIRPNAVTRKSVDHEGRKRKFLNNLKQSVIVVGKKREAGIRPQIIGHLCCIWLYLAVIQILPFLFLYTRKKFEWTYSTYSIWAVCGAPTSILSLCVLLPLLSNYWKVDDAIISFVGAVSSTFSSVIYGTAPAPWALYLGLGVSLPSAMSVAGSRGAISKLVAPDELGAVFAVLGLGEAIVPLISNPLITLIYNQTLDDFPGAIFLVGAGLSLVVCCIYTWLATSFLPRPTKDVIQPKPDT